MKESVFTWCVGNVSYAWHNKGEYISSPEFTGPSGGSAWVLKLYPRGSNNTDYASLYLERREKHDDDPMFLTTNVEFTCLFPEVSLRYSPLYRKTGASVACRGKVGDPFFLNRHEVFGRRKAVYLPHDVLTLRCRLWEDDGSGIEESEESSGRTVLGIEHVYSEASINPAISKEKTVSVPSPVEQEDLLSLKTVCREDALDVEMIPVNVKGIKFFLCELSLVDTRTRAKLCELNFEWIGRPRLDAWQMTFVDEAPCDFQFCCKFVYSTGKEIKTTENHCPPKPAHLSIYTSRCIPSGRVCDRRTLWKDLSRLYLNRRLCDVEIQSRTASILAHKAVLCARSPVFLAMFASGMRENANGSIHIDDITDATLEQFLWYLYSNTFGDLTWNAAIGLYYAADKYHVERLKLLCCSYLIKSVVVENVCELLLLADKHHDLDLQTRVEVLIWKNEETVYCSPQWKKFADENESLAFKTMLSKYHQRERLDLNETYEAKLSSQPNALDDFRSLYENQLTTDISIKIADKTIRAHRTVIAASSASLRKDLETDLAEKSSDILEIKDLEYDTVCRLLPCLYSDNYLPHLQWNSASELYHAANVLRIQRLKFNCAYYLLENLRVSNAIELLLLARDHDDYVLESVVQGFICLHDEEIFGSDEWAGFCEANGKWANAIMCAKYRRLRKSTMQQTCSEYSD